ncbi:hypothetical protein [Geodermatophilus sp. CPCC 206100]|uniref:hypothetical protein n=1 Tax=Geodermatophilus sp. CPCC 206100 TaxID=3020054 RepID=UPI003B001DB1
MSDPADWLEQARRLAAGLGDALGQGRVPADGAGAHAADCTWCPVCQVAAVVRGERPEVTAALADLLDAASAALRSFAESATPPRPEPEPEQEAPAEPVVQRIEIA